MAPRLVEIADELIDRAKDKRQMDFIADFAVPLPVIVIAEILGVPIADRADFKHWSDGIVAGDLAAYQTMGNYFRQLIEQRRKSPQRDLISDIIAVHDEGETLSAQELVDFCMVLLVAGNETTTNLLANAIVCLHEFPEAYDRLRAEPTLLLSAIEETLRYRSPAQILPRISKIETQVGGQQLPAGALIEVYVGSANRDETQFDQADQFVIDRIPNEHLAFGNGIHFCLGAPLARLEAKMGLTAILERLPNLRIAPHSTLKLVGTQDVHGFVSLPVLF